MNLRDIKYILTAVETGSFVQAAEVCHISQPSLSIQIKKVEERLGHALFIRHKKGVRLSEFGESVLPYFETVQNNVLKINNLAEKQKGKPAPTMRLGAIATVAPYIFPYLKNTEDVAFEESTTAKLIKKLLDDQIEAALMALPMKIPQLSTMTLYKEPFYLAAAQNNSYAEKMDFETMEPPPECRFLILSEEHCMGEQTINLCRLHPGNNKKVFKANSLETVRHMVATSNDMTLIPALAIRAHDGLAYYSLPSKYHRNIGLVYKKSSKHIDQIHALHHDIKKSSSIDELKLLK